MRSELSRFTMLLITADPNLQRITTWILIEAGFYAAFVDSVEHALAQSHTLAPDVVIFDTPVGDAALMADIARLRAGFPAARLVGLHQSNDPVDAHIEVECHLHKPFTADELLECIESALAASVGAHSVHAH